MAKINALTLTDILIIKLCSSIKNIRCPWCNGYRPRIGHGDASSNPGRE